MTFNEALPHTIAHVLYKHNLLSVIIEGGRQTLQTFIDAGLWDEARVFKGPAIFGNGTKAPRFSAPLLQKQAIQDNELLIFGNYD